MNDWELGPPDFPNPFHGQRQDDVCFADAQVTVQCSGSLQLRFQSGTNQALTDEGWAFSDVTVIASTGNVVLLTENGAVSAGWSGVGCTATSDGNKITQAGSTGLVHGPWGSECLHVSKTVAIPPQISQCQVSWRSWSLGSRDREIDRVLIDGSEVWQRAADRRWQRGPADFMTHAVPHSPYSFLSFDEVRVQVPCSSSMQLTFRSGTNQALSDEGWAFSDVTVVSSRTTPDVSC